MVTNPRGAILYVIDLYTGLHNCEGGSGKQRDRLIEHHYFKMMYFKQAFYASLYLPTTEHTYV